MTTVRKHKRKVGRKTTTVKKHTRKESKATKKIREQNQHLFALVLEQAKRRGPRSHEIVLEQLPKMLRGKTPAQVNVMLKQFVHVKFKAKKENTSSTYIVLTALVFRPGTDDIDPINDHFKSQGWGSVSYAMQLKTLAGHGGGGGRSDVVFKWTGTSKQMGKLAVGRLMMGANAPRWLDDYMDNNKEIISPLDSERLEALTRRRMRPIEKPKPTVASKKSSPYYTDEELRLLIAHFNIIHHHLPSIFNNMVPAMTKNKEKRLIIISAWIN